MGSVWREANDRSGSLQDGSFEVAFIDTSVDGWQGLADGLPSGIAAVLLDGGSDGLAQMAAWAAGRRDCRAIHILSHGGEGYLQLGGLTLDSDTLENRTDDLHTLAAMLAADSDILLYGCNVAAGDGARFLDALAGITGANVAASRTLTGAAELGGDWTLGWGHGAVRAQALRIDGWHGVLGLPGGPTYVSSVGYIGESFITLTFSADLDDGFSLDLNNFLDELEGNQGSVKINGTAKELTGAVVSGATLTLSWNGPLLAGDIVDFYYEDPAGDQATGVLQGTPSGSDVTSFLFPSIVIVTSRPAPPELVSAAVSGPVLVLTYDVTLDVNNVPANGDFVVTVDGQAVAVNAVYVDGKTVSLTLASATPAGVTVTVSYTDPTANDDPNAIQSVGGIDAASLVNEPVDNNTPPVLQGAAVNGTTLVLTYDVALDANDGPANGDFVVTVGGQTVAVTDVVVDSISKTVTLTLASAAINGAAVTVSYTDPTDENDASAIQSTSGGDAASLTNQAVTNNTPPTLQSATVNGTALVLTYDVTLDAIDGPATGDFVVTVGGQTITVSSVLVNDKTVTLTLASAVAYTDDEITVSYTDPTSENDPNAIQSVVGDDAASLTNQAVTNSTPNPDGTPPTLDITTVKNPYFASGYGIEGFDLFDGVTASTVDVGQSFTGMVLTVHNVPENAEEFLLIGISEIALNDGASGSLSSGGTYSVAWADGVATVTLSGMLLDNSDMGELIDSILFGKADDLDGQKGHSQTRSIVLRSITDDGAANHTSVINQVVTITIAKPHEPPWRIMEVVPDEPEVSFTPGQARSVSFTMTILDDINFAGQTFDFDVALPFGWSYDNLVVTDAENNPVSLSGQQITYPSTYKLTLDVTGNNSAGLGAYPISILSKSTYEDAYAQSHSVMMTLDAPSAPVLQSAEVNGTSLVLTYDMVLDANNGPVTGDFTVTVGGQTVAVTNIAVDSDGKTVTLTLASVAPSGAAVTVTYRDPTEGNDANAIQSTKGSDAASLTAQPVVNNTPATAPVLQSATVDKAVLVLTYDVALDANNGPVTGDFTVTVGGQTVAVTDIVVDSASKTVTLTLARPAGPGAAVTVTYRDPTEGNDANAIQSTAGMDAASLLNRSVTNNTEDTAPVLQSATVNEATLFLKYDVALDAANRPVNSDFVVTVGGQAVPVIGVAVHSATMTVILTLASAVPGGAIVTVSYTDPTEGNDIKAVQSKSGLDAASLVAHAVVNTTPLPQPPQPGVTETLIDGMVVGSTVTTGTDGRQSQVITIPVVHGDRVEDRVEGTRADIPLVTSGGTSLLEAGLPLGVGMRVEAPSLGAQSGEDARLTLIRAIESRTTGTDQQADRTEMTGLGSQFLDTLPTEGNLLVRIVTPTVPSGTAPGEPIVITGSTGSSSHEGGTGPQVALVIDVRGLPSGTVLQLQDVEFAAIIGAITVTGGDGRQVVTGDSHPQIIVLGADDDVLYAGGGDDLVGSAGGNDRIHGESGNDRMFGGPGDDTLDGGSGIDAARFDGSFADFTITRAGYGVQTVADGRTGSPEGTDSLASVEILRFADGVTLANTPVKVALTEALYLAANPDVRLVVDTGTFASGLEHLVRFGQAEGRLAMLAVDEAFYRAENSDVDRAITNGLFSSAADHFARFGAREGRDPNAMFNTDWYLSQNTDVAGAVTSGLTTAWAHYNSFGWGEGRDPSVWFDTSGYLAAYQDVARAGVNPLIHFVEHGFTENRLAVGNDNGLWLA